MMAGSLNNLCVLLTCVCVSPCMVRGKDINTPENPKKKLNIGCFHLCPKRKGLPRPALLTWGFQALLELSSNHKDPADPYACQPQGIYGDNNMTHTHMCHCSSNICRNYSHK